MNPADKRLAELLDKWLVSLELHLKYSELDEASYRKVQPWPPHDRPSRWIIELARQKATQLREALDSRIAMGDTKFSDALELMGFLQNLVGSQHISRFIPLAEPQNEGAGDTSGSLTSETSLQPAGSRPQEPVRDADDAPDDAAADDQAARVPAEATRNAALATQPRKALHEATATREMPKPDVSATTQSGRKTDIHKAEARKGAARRESKAAAPAGGKVKQESRQGNAARELKVVADAIRLLGWGRKWHELPELISRMADRPPITEVRRILREQKETIEAQSGE